jgi:REP element-mobilizing transposase RayT
MFKEPFQRSELKFAYCYRVYCRWRTYCRVARPELKRLDVPLLNEVLNPYRLHVLEAACTDVDIRTLVSLRPDESVSVAASKLKGRVSKWLREEIGLTKATDLLGRGYFACTCGKNTRAAIEEYLERQAEHHGYDQRVCPPVFVKQFSPSPAIERVVDTINSSARLYFHVVLSTWRRRGVFCEETAQAIAERWLDLQREHRFAIRKVSFVPDHVHIAVRIHSSVVPATMITELLNSAQDLMWGTYARNVIKAGVERLWEPGGYIGSYGELASPQIRDYIRKWESSPA